jgi:hypothetical protein
MCVVNDDLAGAALEFLFAQPQVRNVSWQQIDRRVSADFGVRADDVEEIAAIKARADACVGVDADAAALAEVDLTPQLQTEDQSACVYSGSAVAVDRCGGLSRDETSLVNAVAAMFGTELMVILVSAALRCQPSSVSADWVTSATGSGSAAATPSPKQRRTTTTSAPARRILSTNTRLT